MVTTKIFFSLTFRGIFEIKEENLLLDRSTTPTPGNPIQEQKLEKSKQLCVSVTSTGSSPDFRDHVKNIVNENQGQDKYLFVVEVMGKNLFLVHSWPNDLNTGKNEAFLAEYDIINEFKARHKVLVFSNY